MPTIAENQSAHPEWFEQPANIDGDTAAYLNWQATQPNPFGPGTVGEAWERAGTGHLYRSHVTTAREEVARYQERAKLYAAEGQPAPIAPWMATPAPAAGPAPDVPGFVIGGTATQSV